MRQARGIEPELPAGSTQKGVVGRPLVACQQLARLIVNSVDRRHQDARVRHARRARPGVELADRGGHHRRTIPRGLGLVGKGSAGGPLRGRVVRLIASVPNKLVREVLSGLGGLCLPGVGARGATVPIPVGVLRHRGGLGIPQPPLGTGRHGPRSTDGGALDEVLPLCCEVVRRVLIGPQPRTVGQRRPVVQRQTGVHRVQRPAQCGIAATVVCTRVGAADRIVAAALIVQVKRTAQAGGGRNREVEHLQRHCHLGRGAVGGQCQRVGKHSRTHGGRHEHVNPDHPVFPGRHVEREGVAVLRIQLVDLGNQRITPAADSPFAVRWLDDVVIGHAISPRGTPAK